MAFFEKIETWLHGATKVAAVALVAGAGFAGHAAAATFGFYNITGNDSGDAAIGEAQFFVDVASETGGVSFTVRNTGPAQVTIASIYFDDRAPLLNHTNSSPAVLTPSGSGVNFSQNFPPPPNTLPGGNTVSFNESSGFEANPPPSTNGIDGGENLKIFFSLLSGKTFNDVVSAMGNNNFRVGVHAINYASGGSESFVTVPLPAAAWLLIAGLGGMGLVARRRKAAA